MSWEHEGDMAKSVARRLQAEHLEKINTDGVPFIDEEPVMLVESKSIFSKISFRWRADEESQLDRIRASVDTIMSDMYSDAKRAIDDFYGELRVPERNPDTGMVLTDRQKRIIWQTDDRGKEIEDWNQVTGQDIERCLFDLSRIKIAVAPQVNELLLEAVFAKHIHDDQFQEAYSELVEETIPGRNAYASRKTRQDKYHAYFCYYLWSSAKTLMDEINNFCRILERVRYWRIEENKHGPKAPLV
jgi:hypothetical protein